MKQPPQETLNAVATLLAEHNAIDVLAALAGAADMCLQAVNDGTYSGDRYMVASHFRDVSTKLTQCAEYVRVAELRVARTNKTITLAAGADIVADLAASPPPSVPTVAHHGSIPAGSTVYGDDGQPINTTTTAPAKFVAIDFVPRSAEVWPCPNCNTPMRSPSSTCERCGWNERGNTDPPLPVVLRDLLKAPCREYGELRGAHVDDETCWPCTARAMIPTTSNQKRRDL